MGIEELLLERAKREGVEKDLEKGVEIGREIGIEEGIEKGEYKKALDIALEMKKDGIPIARIQKFTRLSNEEIEKLT